MAMAEVGGGQSQGPRAGELFPPALEGHLAAVARAEADRVAPPFGTVTATKPLISVHGYNAEISSSTSCSVRSFREYC